jgi:cell division protein FtsB
VRKPYTILWSTLGLVVLSVWVYLPVLTKYRELKGQEERMSREIAILDKKIAALDQEREMLRNDVTYLEKTIRDELGFVKPGETVLKFVEEKAPPAPRSAAPASDEAADI